MDFFRFNFDLNKIKMNKKRCKKRAGPTRVRRGTQGHVAEPRGPAQRLRGAYYIPIVYLYYILYI